MPFDPSSIQMSHKNIEKDINMNLQALTGSHSNTSQ